MMKCFLLFLLLGSYSMPACVGANQERPKFIIDESGIGDYIVGMDLSEFVHGDEAKSYLAGLAKEGIYLEWSERGFLKAVSTTNSRYKARRMLSIGSSKDDVIGRYGRGAQEVVSGKKITLRVLNYGKVQYYLDDKSDKVWAIRVRKDE